MEGEQYEELTCNAGAKIYYVTGDPVNNVTIFKQILMTLVGQK